MARTLDPTKRGRRAKVFTDKQVGAIKARCVQSIGELFKQREHTKFIDTWMQGSQLELGVDVNDPMKSGNPYAPRGQADNDEYQDIAARTPAPFGRLIVASVAQTVYMESATIAGKKSNPDDSDLDCIRVLKSNNWSARQIPLTRSTIGHGTAFVKLSPAKNIFTGEDTVKITTSSATRTALFWDDLDDEWANFALTIDPAPIPEGERATERWTCVYTDETGEYQLTFNGRGERLEDWTFDGILADWDLPVCPVIPFTNVEDLDGNTVGEIEPVIPLLRRIDQDTFDRIVVQRFGAWKIRWIAGLAAPSGSSADERRAKALQLKVEDILIAENPETKFGTLDATEIKGFIEAHDADLRVLSAVTQTPPHHLLGLSANLQAEALAAAEAGLQRKSNDFKVYNSGSYQKLLRLIAVMRGNSEEARADEYDIQYRDTESRSLNQAAQALGALATQLGVPVEMLWNRIPDWTDDDTRRALEIIEDRKADALIQAALGVQGGDQAQDQPGQTGTQDEATQSDERNS